MFRGWFRTECRRRFPGGRCGRLRRSGGAPLLTVCSFRIAAGALASAVAGAASPGIATSPGKSSASSRASLHVTILKTGSVLPCSSPRGRVLKLQVGRNRPPLIRYCEARFLIVRQGP